MEIVLYAAPLGLMLDIVGFLLVIRYGHSLFIRTGVGPPSESDLKDWDMYLQYKGPDTEHGRSQGSRHRFRAHLGVATVITGFGLQIVGSTAAIYLCVCDCPSDSATSLTTPPPAPSSLNSNQILTLPALLACNRG